MTDETAEEQAKRAQDWPMSWPKGAVAVVSNLDMLVDEPLELAIALRKLAESKASEASEDNDLNAKEWAKFAEAMSKLVDALKVMNEPPKAE